MFKQEYGLVCGVAQKKLAFLKTDKVGYFASSVLAGVFVGLGVIVVLMIAKVMSGYQGITILQGATFAAALSLIVFAGAELFTGNVFVLTAGLLQGKVEPGGAVRLWLFCYFGNFVGSVLIAALFVGTGLFAEQIPYLVESTVRSKTVPSLGALFVRGILCNILVCAATWCSYKIKSEAGKLIMIFWCIYLFVVSGFEHSIANMTYFSLRVFGGADGAVFLAMSRNLLASTLGNFAGGALLALAYWLMGRNEDSAAH
ncbi:MAG: formate/nitrite transporter family protein [Spirochaetes bacterium]|nr:formate/nitrite transporter family protein [Spirochaetota bacterium]